MKTGLILLGIFIGCLSLNSLRAEVTSVRTIDPSLAKSVSKTSKWQKLLHYKKGWFPGSPIRSELDGKEFFFSPRGKWDPQAELLASAKAFFSNSSIGPLKQHPQCAFPERYRFLKKALALKIKNVSCPRLESFIESFDPQSATLVFSSAYQENPGSMFGHTFLRINRRKKSEKKHSDLLDYGLNFAAVVPDKDSGLGFAVSGLIGGYIGQFSFEPFYLKVKEYNNSESRDLWEYDLNLTREETLSLMRHAWEIQTNSYFDYYFIDENCSYQILALLEVAKPEWDLTDFGIFVIPVETVKKLKKIKGAISKRTYRPSLRNRVYARINNLDPLEKEVMRKILNFEIAPDKVNSPMVLASTAGFLKYLKAKDKTKGKNWSYASTFEDVLSRSSQLPKIAENTELIESLTPEIGPDEGHNPTKLGLGMGSQTSKNNTTSSLVPFTQFSFKLAYHDLLNLDTGYTPYSQIDFPGVSLRYMHQSHKLSVDNLEGMHVTALTPMNDLEKKLSWQLRARYTNSKDPDCAQECGTFNFYGGVGPSATLFSDKNMIYMMLLAEANISSDLPKGRRLGPVMEAATLFQPAARWKFKILTSLHTDLNKQGIENRFYKLENTHSLSLDTNWEIRAGILRYLRQKSTGKNSTEILLSLNHYI